MSDSTPLARWIEYVAEASRLPVDAFPTLGLMELLHETFDAIVEWNHLGQDGTQEWVYLHPPSSWPPAGATEYVLAHLDQHPLVRWYGLTRERAAMTTERVPEQIADRALVAAAREAMAAPEMSQQLAIPVRVEDRSHSVLVLSRGGTDFDERQLELARQLQPLVMLLERTAEHSSRLGESLARRFELTCREASVLALLRQGLTIHAISRQLCCTPRTVEKHVEHLYRKMDVRDRLSALRAADAQERATAPGTSWSGNPRLTRPTFTPPHVAPEQSGLLVITGKLPAASQPIHPSRI